MCAQLKMLRERERERERDRAKEGSREGETKGPFFREGKAHGHRDPFPRPSPAKGRQQNALLPAIVVLK